MATASNKLLLFGGYENDKNIYDNKIQILDIASMQIRESKETLEGRINHTMHTISQNEILIGFGFCGTGNNAFLRNDIQI